MLLELDLHEKGYRYTGVGNLYQLTWHEILDITNGTGLLAELKEDGQKGVTTAKLDKFDQFREKRGLN